MPISFDQIPANFRLPLYWVETDPSQAGLPINKNPALLIGVMATGAPGVPDVPTPIGSIAQVQHLYGIGSQLANMAVAFFNNNFSQETFAIGVSEAAAGTAATGAITITGTATDAGTLFLYIAGHEVQVGVSSGDTATNVATNVAAAVNALPTLPVTAVAAAGVATVTCNWKGTTGNDIDVRDSYYGTLGGETVPPGLVITYPANNKLTGGAGVPIFTNAVTNMGEQEFDYIAFPFTDSNSLLLLETELGFTATGRWGFMRQLYGQLMTAKRDTYANLLTWGPTRNAPTTAVWAIEEAAPSPIWEWVGAITAMTARAFTNDPARPLQTLTLTGILPAPLHQRWNMDEQQSFALNGLATQKTGPGNIVQIMRDTTTYQFNLYGQSDDAYELMTTLATLSTLFRNQRQAITSKFPRSKLANDGTRFGVGQKIVTPKIIAAELIAEYRADEFNGLVENARAFAENLIVERDPNDPNRVNVLYPPDLVNQLRVFAVLAQFRLQYDRGIDTAVAA
jgi:phage tail sheath gpL-like